MGKRVVLAAVLAAGCLSGGCASAGLPLPFDNQGYADYLRDNGEPPYLGKGPILAESPEEGLAVAGLGVLGFLGAFGRFGFPL